MHLVSTRCLHQLLLVNDSQLCRSRARVVFAFVGAKRELIRRSGRLGAGSQQEGQTQIRASRGTLLGRRRHGDSQVFFVCWIGLELADKSSIQRRDIANAENRGKRFKSFSEMELPGSTGPHALEYKAQTVQKPRATWRRISCGRIRTTLPTTRTPGRGRWEHGLRCS